ncbi:hypothetical protein HEO38_025735 [Escherichia coli]|nr:hypothetical protein [Escherichia coli]
MKLHSTETSWVAGRCESYDKKTGYRWGAPNMRRPDESPNDFYQNH